MKKRILRFGITLAVLFLCGSLPVSAGRIDFSTAFCVEEIIDFTPENVWAPVGCELVDCCTGCPGPPIDWRIRLTGNLLQGVVLQFENLPPEAAAKLGIKGAGKWEGSNLQVGPGETILTGFNVDSKGAIPVAIPRLLLNKEGVKNLPADAPDAARDQADQKSPDAKDAGKIQVTIEQMRGDFIVNEMSLVYRLIRCPPPQLPPTDRIDLNNNTTNDSAVVLLDARTLIGCVDDQIVRGSDIINLGSVLTNGGCNSEVAVFSDDNAMQLTTPVNTWTDPLGDTLPIPLAPILNAPVSVWLVGTDTTAVDDIAAANLLYNSNNVGIAFDATFNDISATPGAENTITSLGDLITTVCRNVANIERSAFFTANRLNVYYVDSAFTGVNCGANSSIQFVGTNANTQTLAHEFGHSFSLVPVAGGHTNGLPGFDATNVMFAGGAGRTHFSEGQAFRMNVDTTSTLNTNRVRTGVTRRCPVLTTTDLCPRLALNATPK